MSRSLLLPLMLALLAMAATIGCVNDSPVSTGFTDEAGYSLNLGAPAGRVPFGGRLVLTGTIRDGQGKTVDFSPFPVTFTSEQGGEFAPMQAQIASGVISTIYVAPKVAVGSQRGQVSIPTIDSLPTPPPVTSDLPIVETITMNFLGASAKLRITLFRP
jgi:hypothetical protein